MAMGTAPEPSGAPWTTTCLVARPSSGRVFWNPTNMGKYPQGRVVTDKEMAAIRREHHRFHGDWNYTILPRGQQRAQRHVP